MYSYTPRGTRIKKRITLAVTVYKSRMELYTPADIVVLNTGHIFFFLPETFWPAVRLDMGRNPERTFSFRGGPLLTNPRSSRVGPATSVSRANFRNIYFRIVSEFLSGFYIFQNIHYPGTSPAPVPSHRNLQVLAVGAFLRAAAYIFFLPVMIFSCVRIRLLWAGYSSDVCCGYWKKNKNKKNINKR